MEDGSDVARESVREAPGNNAEYISLLRGFPVLIRRPPEVVSDDFAGNGRGGGGILFGARVVVACGGCALSETIGHTGLSTVGRVTGGCVVVGREFLGTGGIAFCGRAGGCVSSSWPTWCRDESTDST